MEPSETIGERLRRLRTEGGFSQRDLASPGVTYAYISRIEAGARRPSVKALRMLAKKLGVTADYLETGSQLGAAEARELRLADLELQLRLDGNVPAAELEQILDEALAAADMSAATRARTALGMAAFTRTDYTETIRHLEAAVETGQTTPASRPDVYVTLGRAYAARGTPRKAVELFQDGLEYVQANAPHDRGVRVRFSSYLSFALTDLGELARARAVVTEVLAETEEASDPYTRVRLYWSLGNLSLEESKPQAALDSYRRAIGLLEATDDTLHLARAHLACAHALVDSGDLNEATAHIDRSERLLGAHPSDNDLAVVRRMQATCAARGSSLAEAERFANEGLILAGELPNEQGLLWWALAEARAGDGGDADDAFRNAIELLSEHGTVREYANLLRAYGRYLRDSDREHDALEIFERAANVASNLQGEPSTAERAEY